MEIRKTDHTLGEVAALIGPILHLDPEQINDFIIIAPNSRCEDCGRSHGIRVTTSFEALDEYLIHLNRVIRRTIDERHDL